MLIRSNLSIMILVISFVVIANTIAHSASSAFMNDGKPASVPIGHYQFCKRNPAECNIQTKGDVRLRLTQNSWEMLLRVNSQVNKSATEVSDLENYGQEEYWTYPNNAGDEEDYILQKRKILVDRGWPVAALLLTVVNYKVNNVRAVALTVRTDRGDFLLSSISDDIHLWNEQPYFVVLKRQSKNHTGKWTFDESWSAPIALKSEPKAPKEPKVSKKPKAPKEPKDSYVAVSIGEDRSGNTNYEFGFSGRSEKNAKKFARRKCLKYADKCRDFAWTKNGCLAIAVGENRNGDVYTQEYGNNRKKARSGALRRCRNGASSCRIDNAACSWNKK